MTSTCKPATSRGALRREALIDAATEVFLEHGFAGATLDMIIKRAGGSRRTLYEMFGDKSGLFGAVMGQRCQRLLDHFNALELDNLDLRESLVVIGETFINQLLAPTALDLFRVLVAESPNFPDLGEQFFHCAPDAIRDRLSAYLAQQVRNGRLTLVSPDDAARQFLGMVKADLQIRALLDPGSLPGPAERRNQIGNAVDIFLDGCRHASR